MSRLRHYFDHNKGRLIDKWHHYFDIYERHFNRFVGKKINVLEIGVFHGGSLQMWKDYFGENATIYGMDINPVCKSFEEERINIIIGDQGDREFWKNIKPELPKFDIIIDDGGHFMDQQKITFEEMFPLLAIDGVFLVEDLHTSYWEEYGGGYQNPNSFVEYSKNLIDELNAWHSRDQQLTVTPFTSSAWGISFYDSIAVIEKRLSTRPTRSTTGDLSW